jgi:hypothetical protein
MSSLFAVMSVEKKGQVCISPGAIVDLDLQWAEGMIGCIPVFESREAADAYNECRTTVVEVGIK